VSYSQSRVDSVTDLEKRWVSGVVRTDGRLSSLGYEAGHRILSLLLLRNTQTAGGKVRPAFLSIASPFHC
jgi:hypothetical protein